MFPCGLYGSLNAHSARNIFFGFLFSLSEFRVSFFPVFLVPALFSPTRPPRSLAKDFDGCPLLSLPTLLTPSEFNLSHSHPKITFCFSETSIFFSGFYLAFQSADHLRDLFPLVPPSPYAALDQVAPSFFWLPNIPPHILSVVHRLPSLFRPVSFFFDR